MGKLTTRKLLLLPSETNWQKSTSAMPWLLFPLTKWDTKRDKFALVQYSHWRLAQEEQSEVVFYSVSFCFEGVGLNSTTQSVLSRPMQRKLVTLVHCQLVEEEGRIRAMRAARSLGERTVTELILQHQNPQQLSSNLWAAVRARGCQFLGPGGWHHSVTAVLEAV